MIEFKMQYAYTSVLFPLVTDSRAGTHAVLDVREYFFVRGQKLAPGTRIPDGAIDKKLTNRTTALMQYTLEMPQDSNDIRRNNPRQHPRDYIFHSIQLHENHPSSSAFVELGHVLGPLITDDITKRCNSMIISRVRSEIFASQKLKGNKTGTGSSNEVHCPVCYKG